MPPMYDSADIADCLKRLAATYHAQAVDLANDPTADRASRLRHLSLALESLADYLIGDPGDYSEPLTDEATISVHPPRSNLKRRQELAQAHKLEAQALYWQRRASKSPTD